MVRCESWTEPCLSWLLPIGPEISFYNTTYIFFNIHVLIVQCLLIHVALNGTFFYSRAIHLSMRALFFLKDFFFNSVLRPFQDYFSSYETGQSVGGRKREDPEKNHLAHPQAELGLSHMWPERGSNPHQTQR